MANTPPPLYMTAIPGEEPSYCHTCGRVVGSRKLKSAKSSATPSRYCSDKCKFHKPSSSATSIDRAIEDVIYQLLEDKEIAEITKGLPQQVLQFHVAGEGTKAIEDTRGRGMKKGDHRVLVPCSLVETVVFGRASNVSRGQGRRRRARDALGEVKAVKDDDAYDEEKLLATLGRLKVANQPKKEEVPSESESSDDEEADLTDEGVPLEGAEKVTQETLDLRRKEGQRRAEQRERVRNGCRRAVIFGLREPGQYAKVPEAVEDPSKGHKKGLSTGSASKMDDWSSEDEGRKGKKGKKGKNSGPKTHTDPQDAKQSKGYAVVDGERRKLCEAIMKGEVIEPSFAKGEWGVKWREEY